MIPFSEIQLRVISNRVTAMLGLFYPEGRWGDLTRGITAAAGELGISSPEAFVEWLIDAPPESREIEVLARYLTIGETYFFRENQVFSILKETIFPTLIQSRRGTDQQIRIWCAGCSSGEEPYSVAILLHRLIPDIEDWRVTIHATDINPDVLKKASQGIYTEWSFRETEPWLKRTYFTEVGRGTYEVIPAVKRMVTFSRYNLVNPPPSSPLDFSAFDIILCRNVLMYFSPGQARSVVSHFFEHLNQDGWLIVSVTEVSAHLFPQFKGIIFPQAMLYQKKVGSFQQERTGPVVAPPAVQPSRVKNLPRALLPATSGAPDQIRPVPAPEPADLAIFRNEAKTLFTRRRYRDAMERGQKVLEIRPGDADMMALLSRCSANQGDLTEAKEWCEQAILARRTEPVFHYLMSSILQELDEEGEAIRSLQRVLYLDQNAVLAHYDLGNLALRRGEIDEAVRQFGITQRILATRGENEEIPDSGGLNSASLARIVKATMERLGEQV
ncbi:CheR family methyltransferase [Methanosphaerula palustris]|uniref:MCP methyltransferase, CheR-type n=1 Tax=Methanosphaerula palustris (strain ATCC BAA-1556 / DSM 19958 / E1-9c) TaxID=521011 RepID=B8GHQ4_METPE|nr:CheR family methyltransferase [Methanosphaerula palustris]ACL16659.1 MCP methyltransferase, CheR-type [Methanosphaerula palustris E1-9c]